MSKQAVFADRAALLAPDCQAYASGLFDLTVPAGETWYVFNAWFCRFPVSTPQQPTEGHAFFHRKIGADDAMLLTAGTRILGTNASSYLWYARPSLVQSDPRYLAAEDLYYERLNRLRTMPLSEIGQHRPQNTLWNQSSPGAAFPTDFTRGLISHVSCHDLCWVTLVGSNGYIVNTLDEINDIHQQRFTSSVLQPFLRGWWNGIQLGHGVAGDYQYAAQSYPGWGVVKYYKLPSDW